MKTQIFIAALLLMIVAGCSSSNAPSSPRNGDKLVSHSDTTSGDLIGGNSTRTVSDTYQRADGSSYKVVDTDSAPGH
jgi:uncharacterized lipoprotein